MQPSQNRTGNNNNLPKDTKFNGGKEKVKLMRNYTIILFLDLFKSKVSSPSPDWMNFAFGMHEYIYYFTLTGCSSRVKQWIKNCFCRSHIISYPDSLKLLSGEPTTNYYHLCGSLGRTAVKISAWYLGMTTVHRLK